jgi:hypothetical protein
MLRNKRVWKTVLDRQDTTTSKCQYSAAVSGGNAEVELHASAADTVGVNLRAV